MKKTFILTQFGTPHSWTQEFVDRVQFLKEFGWYFKIFTPNPLDSKGNVCVIKMTPEQFNDLVEYKLGTRPKMFTAESGLPSVHITDYCIAYGRIFEDYLKDSVFWGMCGWDIVMGRLDHFLPDKVLSEYDVWTDDLNTINGTFCLFRNREDVNNLFKKIPDWEKMFAQEPCQKCLGNPEATTHTLYGTDEFAMTEVLKEASSYIHPPERRIRYGYPQYYPLHSHDRLEHQLEPKLKVQEDNSLWELFADVNPPKWIHARPFFGREIPYYHFMKGKAWPQCLKDDKS